MTTITNPSEGRIFKEENMRFWLWVGILAGLFMMDMDREWRQPASTKGGPTPVFDDPGPKPTPRA
jgi:hypothetical protein